MLPAAHRLRSSADFSAVLRRGRRARAATMVVHQHRARCDSDEARAGLVVSRAVGGSVVRHAVSRKLRAQLSLRLSAFDPGTDTVVRALPASAAATSAQLGADLDRTLAHLARSR